MPWAGSAAGGRRGFCGAAQPALQELLWLRVVPLGQSVGCTNLREPEAALGFLSRKQQNGGFSAHGGAGAACALLGLFGWAVPGEAMGLALGLATSPPAEMVCRGGQDGGSGVSALPGPARWREGGIQEKAGTGRTSLPVSSAPRASHQTSLSSAGCLGRRWPGPPMKCLQFGRGTYPQLPPCHRWPWEKCSLFPFPLCQGFLCSN